MFRRTAVFASVLALAMSVAHAADDTKAKPWTHQKFADRPEDFTFAVVSDLTGGERPGIFDVAVEQLNLLQPAFVMSVGDLIDGYVRDENEVVRQWEHFDSRVDKIVAPFFYVVGNHDITNTMMRRVWERRLGPRYYHLTYKNALFLVLDSEDFEPKVLDDIFDKYDYVIQRSKQGDNGPMKELRATLDWEGRASMQGTQPGTISDAQVAYFERVINENRNVRWTFLFLHRPLWQVNNEGLRRIEAALGDRPFTTIAGHVHGYRNFETERGMHVRLGTTGGGWEHNPNADGNFDHIMMVRMTASGPVIANLRLDGILNDKGKLPGDGAKLCFSEQTCARQ